jgi:hypothetical protein
MSSKKSEILKLNKNLFPISVSTWQRAFTDILSGSVKPIDISMSSDNEIEYFHIVDSWESWSKLEINNNDEFISGAGGRKYKLPAIIVCNSYDKIPYKTLQFPSKQNIWKRDNYICQYTGELLTKETVSTDHIIPISKGGKNTWTNLVTCSKSLNVWKADRTPEECGLKLINQPYQPKNGRVLDFMRPEWEKYVFG